MKYDDIKFTLQRKLAVKAYLVQADIQVETPAGIFGIIADLTEECGGIITETLIQEELEFTVPMARRTITRCVDGGILEKTDDGTAYKLTEFILESIADGNVFRPESGEYLLYYTDDPLIEQKFITFQRVDRRTSGNHRSNKNTKKIEIQLDRGKYNNIIPDRNEEKSGFINSERIIIETIQDVGIPQEVRNSNLFVKCEITPSYIDVSIIGEFKKKKIVFSLQEIPEDFNFESIFNEILLQLDEKDNWHDELRMLNVKFDPMHPKNIDFELFTKKFHLDAPSLEGFGTFNDVKLVLPVRPRNQSDCLAWEKYLFFNRLREICFDDEFTGKQVEVEYKMKDHCDMMVKMPSREEMIQELLENCIDVEKSQDSKYGPRNQEYWFLQAPLDLS
ncbi:MAG: hypothetical protein ACTSUE_06310 [Promethearchaeota archaeon]